MNSLPIPDDFPRALPLGSVSGVQPKLLALKTGAMYRAVQTESAVYERYLVCNDLAQQLAAYVSRKMTSTTLSLDRMMFNVETGLRKKVRSGVWVFSEEEMAWALRRTHQFLRGEADAEARLERDETQSQGYRDGE